MFKILQRTTFFVALCGLSTGNIEKNENFGSEDQTSTQMNRTLTGLTSNFPDAIFTYIERSQVEYGKPFKRFLDAGTGKHSFRWIGNLIKNKSFEGTPLQVENYVAVTADTKMRKSVKSEAQELGVEGKGEIVIGNYFPTSDKNKPEDKIATENFLENELFDTILADYLIGAMDGFSPYFQDLLFERLNRHLRPGGRLYVIGKEPVPHQVEGDANIICKISKLRDACLLLAGHRCYREYPLEWVLRNVKIIKDLVVVNVSKFPIRYSYNSMLRQLKMSRDRLKLLPTEDLSNAMRKVIDDLDEEAQKLTSNSPTGRVELGFDYVVVIEKSYDQKCDSSNNQ